MFGDTEICHTLFSIFKANALVSLQFNTLRDTYNYQVIVRELLRNALVQESCKGRININGWETVTKVSDTYTDWKDTRNAEIFKKIKMISYGFICLINGIVIEVVDLVSYVDE